MEREAEARGQRVELRRGAEAWRRKAEAMSPSVQAEVLRKMVAVAPEKQRLIERAVRIGCKTRRSAALRNGYRIPAWHCP